jgi:hypothetical protein
MPSQQLKKLGDELTKAMGLWTDLVATVKLTTWPSIEDLQDEVGSSAAWQELHSDLGDLADQAKEVEHLARDIDEEIALLTGRLRAGDPDIAADDTLVVFLGVAVPDRRYELVYEIQKLLTLTDRVRAEGKVAPSPAWSAQLSKIQQTVQRGFEGCEWQFNEVSQNLGVDPGTAPSPTPSPSPTPTPAPPAAHHPEPEPRLEVNEPQPEPHQENEAEAAGEAKVAEEARVAEEDENVVGAVVSLVDLAEAAEAAAEAVTSPSGSSSGDSDARVEEDILDGS